MNYQNIATNQLLRWTLSLFVSVTKKSNMILPFYGVPYPQTFVYTK